MTATENQEFTSMLAAVFSRHSANGEAPRGAPMRLDRGLWSTLDELGITRLTAPEAQNGSAASWAEAALLLSEAGRHGANIPIAENDLLAHWLLDLAGISAADDLLRTACVVDADGAAREVGWAREVDRVVIAWQTTTGWQVADVERDGCGITEHANMADEPRDQVRVDISRLNGSPVSADVGQLFWLRGALARTQLMAGAMERILELVVEHTTARTQFGRALAQFQAVQFMAADIAAESALARASADAAVRAVTALGIDSPQAAFAIAAAKSCTGHAATVVARKAHQAFGAIGFTMEHELHRHTTRALSWRSEFGSVRHWDDRLTQSVVAAGSQGVWPLLAD